MYTVVSYNGTAINTPDLETVLEETRNKKLQAGSRVLVADRGPHAPKYTGIKGLEPRYMNLTCIPRRNAVEQTEDLMQLFATQDQELHSLILMDTTGKRWICQATCYAHEIDEGLSVIQLEIPSGQIYSETPGTDSLAITATGDYVDLVVGGHYPTRPTFTITPTSAKNSDDVGYKRFARWYNVLANRLFRYPFDLTDGGIDTAALVNYTAISNQIDKVGGIGAADTEIPIDTAVGGGLPAAGMGYVGTEQISWTGQSGGELTGVTRGIGGTTAATHADNAVIAQSKVLANGDDLLVWLNGAEYPRWLSGMNTTTTKVWCSITWKPTITLKLATALATGALTEIEFKNIAASTNALKKLPKSGYLIIDSEILYYTARVIRDKTVTGIKRAQMGTSQATHAAGATVRWVEHEILLSYGDKSAEAPEYAITLKPLFDLSTSTNTSWVLAEFSSAGRYRPFEWDGSVLASSGGESLVYTGVQGAFADPATEMGMLAQVWQQAGVWKGETARMEWRLNQPCGFTTVTCSGEKYRQYVKWLTFRLQKSNDGINWEDVFTEATPASAGSWGALSAHSGVSLGGTYKWLRFFANGSLPATANNSNGFSIKDFTGVVDSANIPQGSLGSEVTTAYSLRIRLTNNLTDRVFRGRFLCKLNDVIEIDCEARTISNLTTGADLLGGKDMPPALEWFTLEPGTNRVRFYDAGTSGVSMVVDWLEYN